MLEAPTLNLAVFISGRGSNMEALLKACAQPDFPARVSVVLANNAGAGGLTIAASYGVPTVVVDHRLYDTKAAFEAAMQEALSAFPVDYICLAGFMRLLSASFIALWPDRILNIHPSLLPAYKGLHTHERALADGVAEAGCTVHFVRPAMDDGPIILQKSVPVVAGDTVETLAARILVEEHKAYPEAVRLLADKRISIIQDKVHIS